MALKFVEAVFTIAFVGIVLTHANQMAQVIKGVGSTYTDLVSGLQHG